MLDHEENFSIALNSNVSGHVKDGTEIATLAIAAINDTVDRNFTCRVYHPGSPHFEVTASVDVFGMIFQALDLLT